MCFLRGGRVMKVKVVGTPNLDELKKAVEQVAYEIYVLQQKAS